MRRGGVQPRVWLMPVFIGLASAAGLVTALLDDGVGEVFSWIALGLPVVLSFWYLAGLNLARIPGRSGQPKSHTHKATG